MSFLPILLGIIIAALIFCAFLWQIYRAVTTTGLIRWNAVGLCLGTLAFMAAISLRSDPLFMVGTLINLLLAPIAIWADPRWSKLLPMVQLGMGLLVIYLIFSSSNLPTAAA